MHENESIASQEQKEKPLFLYHGSPNREIHCLEPQAKKVRRADEGPVIFATQDIALATMFMMSDMDDSWTNSGLVNGIPYVVIADKERFMHNDRGGSIYRIPSTTFITKKDLGLGENEWVSVDPVIPIDQVEYDSVLDAMVEKGVQVYFIDRAMLNEFKESSRIPELLRGLVSENRRLEKNVKEM